VLVLGGRCPAAGRRPPRTGFASAPLRRRPAPADRPRDLADAFVLPGEQHHVLALLDAKMAAMLPWLPPAMHVFASAIVGLPRAISHAQESLHSE